MPLDLGNLNEGYISIDYVGKTDPLDTYKFNCPNARAVQVSAHGFSNDSDTNLKKGRTQVIKAVSAININPASLRDNNFSSPNFYAEILPSAEDTNSIPTITSGTKVNDLSKIREISKIFVPNLFKKLGIYSAYDGIFHHSKLAIVNTFGRD